MNRYLALARKAIQYLKNTGATGGSDGLYHLEGTYSFLREAETPADTEALARELQGPVTLNWVIPEMDVGSGGHTTIFRAVSYLEKHGIKNRVYTYHPCRLTTDEALRRFLHENFPVLDERVEVHCGTEGMPAACGVVATSWITAYAVRGFHNTVSRFYFVQDYEPYFYPMGSEYELAKATYGFGFHGITAGDWLKDKLMKEHGMNCASFRFSYDREKYYPVSKKDETPRVFFYARPSTPRRAFEIGMLALERLHEMKPEVELVMAGGDTSAYAVPFPHRSVGIVSADKLRELYGQSDICLVMSLTNLSLLPLEIMACGSVAATQLTENNTWMLGRENTLAVGVEPEEIAQTLCRALDDPNNLSALREAGMRLAQSTSWDNAFEKVFAHVVSNIEKDSARMLIPE